MLQLAQRTVAPSVTFDEDRGLDGQVGEPVMLAPESGFDRPYFRARP